MYSDLPSGPKKVIPEIVSSCSPKLLTTTTATRRRRRFRSRSARSWLRRSARALSRSWRHRVIVLIGDGRLITHTVQLGAARRANSSILPACG